MPSALPTPDDPSGLGRFKDAEDRGDLLRRAPGDLDDARRERPVERVSLLVESLDFVDRREPREGWSRVELVGEQTRGELTRGGVEIDDPGTAGGGPSDRELGAWSGGGTASQREHARRFVDRLDQHPGFGLAESIDAELIDGFSRRCCPEALCGSVVEIDERASSLIGEEPADGGLPRRAETHQNDRVMGPVHPSSFPETVLPRILTTGFPIGPVMR